MVGVLTRGERAVVAGEATRSDALMSEIGWLPSRGDVASLAVVAHRNMGSVLARGNTTVVAGGTAIKDAVMRERRGLPRLCGMANVAVLPRNEVCRALARSLHVIVATAAAAEHLAVVELYCRLERLRRVAALAAVRA